MADISGDMSYNDDSGKIPENVEDTNRNILNMINNPTIITGVSHEMRTHMNSIVAFSFLMNNGECDEKERKEFSKYILNSCEQLIGLFDNFLDSAIIDTGNSKAEPRSCNLGNIIDDLLSEFRVILKREDHKDLVLILENQAKREPEVYIDSNRVVRVIRNLFQNALYNTKTGYIKIGYYFREEYIIFYVLDSGTGYQKCREFLHSENLNEALRLHNDTTSAINLSLAKKLVTIMDGKIWVESNGIEGAGMYFSIPVQLTGKQSISINKYTNTRIAI
jgi:two-component system, sensor histidine kinase and response regulator